MLKQSLLAILFLSGITTAWSDDPKPYSINRYNILWQNESFQNKPQVTTTPTHGNDSESEWAVAGIFSIDGKQGAIIINLKTKAVEQIGPDSDSPSGFRLARVHSSKPGQAQKIEISQNGQRIMLTSIPKSSNQKASPTTSRRPTGSKVALRRK